MDERVAARCDFENAESGWRFKFHITYDRNDDIFVILQLVF